jgi:predicted XRE-type DNA-binding protein
MVRTRNERIKVTPSSGNVFDDIGLPEPEEALARAQLAYYIERAIARRRLTQAKAAVLMGIDQPKLVALINGRLQNFSSERLMRLLIRLGQDIDIRISTKPHRRRQGRIRVLGEMSTWEQALCASSG